MIRSELVFLRHGQAQCNLDGLVGGPRTCTGLTDRGRAQVMQAALRLSVEHSAAPFTALYTGPRLRLEQTGAILAETLDLPLHIEPGLDGPIHGEADGRPWQEVKAVHGGGPHIRPDSPWAIGSDTWNAYLRRAGHHLLELITRHSTDRILIAAHGEIVLAAHTLLLGLPEGTASGFTVDHASLTRWHHHQNRRGQQRWMLDRHNDTAHLVPEAAS